MELLSLIIVVSGIISAIIIAVDLQRNPQSMRIMDSVWVLTALWSSVLGLWAYYSFGREHRESNKTMGTDHRQGHSTSMNMSAMDPSMANMKMDNTSAMHMNMPHHKKWQSVILSTLHCGAGCTLADLIGEGVLFFFPIAIGGSILIGSWVIDYILALIIGIYFQYAAIRSISNLSAGKTLSKAFKADVFSLTAWKIGMYGWMAIVIFAIRGGVQLPHDSWIFWFMMQIAMLFGFITALPINVLLIKLGVKHGM